MHLGRRTAAAQCAGTEYRHGGTSDGQDRRDHSRTNAAYAGGYSCQPPVEHLFTVSSSPWSRRRRRRRPRAEPPLPAGRPFLSHGEMVGKAGLNQRPTISKEQQGSAASAAVRRGAIGHAERPRDTPSCDSELGWRIKAT
jgi:hypothetical protein